MADRLRNKVAIITGAARGIGARSAELFAQEGAAVAVWDINQERGTDVVDCIQSVGGKAVFCPCDVTKDQQIQQAVDQTVSKFGYPSVLFNNAGIAVVGEIEQITPEDWDHQYEVNVKSIYLVSRAVIPVMRQAGGGSIINMGSESAFVGFPMHPAYTSSKAAVVHLTRSMAVRYAPEKIRVNSLCPGTINTELLTEFLAQQDDPEAVKEEIRDMHPLGIGEPEDIAWAAVYLASDESKYMTGAPMLVEGGILTL
ncbi:MAG: SDR family oxidoreductase [Candidatus Poribacteria bacterium]|nr:SDR family oxidoreductase [Candidatus Poribacteria bacterium]MDP6997683.1 SDR family oxidoreductase [Candidatus Poribacteria bacterium]